MKNRYFVPAFILTLLGFALRFDSQGVYWLWQDHIIIGISLIATTIPLWILAIRENMKLARSYDYRDNNVR